MSTEAAATTAGNKRKPDSQDIVINGKKYYHPFPSSKSASAVWRVFRLERDLDYQETNKVFCVKCTKQSANGKTILHSEKRKQGGTTEPMRRHMRKCHLALCSIAKHL